MPASRARLTFAQSSTTFIAFETAKHHLRVELARRDHHVRDHAGGLPIGRTIQRVRDHLRSHGRAGFIRELPECQVQPILSKPLPTGYAPEVLRPSSW